MEFPQSSVPDQQNVVNAASADLRLQSTPDYGTLGPGPDVAEQPANGGTRPARAAYLFALALGVLLAVLVGSLGRARAAWTHFNNHPQPVASTVAANAPQLDQMKPQKQAEALLELAVGHSDGAVEQIASRVDRWQGQLVWDSQMASLTTAALNSSDMRVRQSAIEVELSAYGLGKNSTSLESVLRTAESSDHGGKIWALWAIGLLGNRGVGTEQVSAVLISHLKDSDEDLRYWAVEGLALVGTDQTIPVLLAVMHDDSSPKVREAAACGVAQSGMYTHQQRLGTVPRLLSYTDDPALDGQTRSWAFQALADITGEHLPNDSATWRSWYASRN